MADKGLRYRTLSVRVSRSSPALILMNCEFVNGMTGEKAAGMTEPGGRKKRLGKGHYLKLVGAERLAVATGHVAT